MPNLLNFLQNSPLIQWAILVLSISHAVLILTLVVSKLILPLFSTLTKSQKQNLQNFLMTLSNCSTEILPNLSNALTTILSNKGLLNTSNQNLKEETTPYPLEVVQFINMIKESNSNEKH